MTQRARGNDNIISIFGRSRKMADNEKSLSQRRDRQPITIRVESVTARFYLSRSLWRTVSNMCSFELRDQLVSIGIRPDDWYLSEDQSLVLMVDEKEFPHTKDILKDLLLRIHRTSLEQQTPNHTAEHAEETVTASTPLPGAP